MAAQSQNLPGGGASTKVNVEMNKSQVQPGMQESDLLDLMALGERRSDPSTDHVALVSLGCFCGPKLSFKKVGRGSESLPFDWMRTRVEGLLHFYRNDFDGFFDFVSVRAVPGSNMTMYRGYYHSFWHDDPLDHAMVERYTRRIKRMQAIDASNKTVLFVRTVVSTDELKYTEELFDELVKRHGRFASLVTLIDFQKTAIGAAVVETHPNLLFYFIGGDAHTFNNGNDASAPYQEPVLVALKWAVGQSIEAMKFDTLEGVFQCADPTHWGLAAMGGHKAFEESPEYSEAPHGVDLPKGLLPVEPSIRGSAALERSSPHGAPAASEATVTVVPLGCSCATKLTLLSMGLAKDPMPFDWVRLSHEGAIHYLENGFGSFMKYTLRKPLPDEDNRLFCDNLHSFYLDDPDEADVISAYQERFENFMKLETGMQSSLLFVRAVATTDEVARVGELVRALNRKYGGNACLLLIIDYQQSNLGPYVVDDYEDLLVYFLQGAVHEGESREAPYVSAVNCAIDWVTGEPLEASCVSNISSLYKLVDETRWGLVGPANFRAFDDPPVPREKKGQEQVKLDPNVEAELDAGKELVELISLGCHPAVRQAFWSINRPASLSPFDDARAPLDGVFHFFENDFSDFGEYTMVTDVPGTDGQVFRSPWHSFTGTCPPDKGQLQEQVVQRFLELQESPRPKLFVRVVATSEEILQLGRLLDELQTRFGRRIRGRSGVCLLVIVDSQPEARLLSVEDTFNILISFVVGDSRTSANGAILTDSVNRGLDLCVGKPLTCSVASDWQALADLVAPTSAGLQGPGGVSIIAESPNGSAAATAAVAVAADDSIPDGSAATSSSVTAHSAEAPTPATGDAAATVKADTVAVEDSSVGKGAATVEAPSVSATSVTSEPSLPPGSPSL